jgi:hypothetical protein
MIYTYIYNIYILYVMYGGFQSHGDTPLASSQPSFMLVTLDPSQKSQWLWVLYKLYTKIWVAYCFTNRPDDSYCLTTGDCGSPKKPPQMS